MEQTRHAHCRLARAGRAFEEGFSLDGTLSEQALRAVRL
jgi:hypothetical protein